MVETERLYYTDPYIRVFEANVVERLEVGERFAVVLDRTAFYPTGGGQPCDLGKLGGVDVVDVFERDGAVIHVLAAELSSDKVIGELDWERRFDHMQHHTGQHILSAAFKHVLDVDTVGFHLGDEVTIDLNRRDIPADALDAVEDLANSVVTADIPVRAWFPSSAELSLLELRKKPGKAGIERLRVVQIGDFDATACGGTHVARTGQIGLIKVVKSDRRGGEIRVHFLCGGRALGDYRLKNSIANRLSAQLTVAYAELPRAVDRLLAEVKAANRELRSLKKRLIGYEADELLASSEEIGGIRVIKAVFGDRDGGELRTLAGLLTARSGVVALLASAGERAQIVMARSADVDADMSMALNAAFGAIGAGRGGGSSEFAQGGGLGADEGTLRAALDAASAAL